MKNKELWIIVSLLAGFFLAVFAFNRVHRRQHVIGNVPPSAQPRYIGFGEFYDPYAIWPYGSNSNYSLFLDTNSGVPTTEVADPGYRSSGTAPGNSIFGGGNGAGPSVGVGGAGLGGGVGGGGGRG